MAFAGLNYQAVLLAAVVSFLFGGVWYGLLSKPWMAAAGMDAKKLEAAGSPVKPMVLAFLCLIVMAWVLAGLIGHLGAGQVTLRNGLISGAFAWLGFVATTLTVNHAFQDTKRALTLIDGGHWLGVLSIQGAIIGWMGVG